MAVQISIKLSLVFLIGLVGIVSAANMQREMRELSDFLKVESSSDEPRDDVELIKAKRQELEGKFAVGTIIGLAEGPCEARFNLAFFRVHLKKLKNQKLVNLFSHVAKSYLNRCMPEYQTYLARALTDIGEEQQSKLVELLSENLVQKYRSKIPDLVDDVLGESERGDLITHSLPLLVEFMEPKFEGTFDLDDKKHLAIGTKMLLKRLARVCPAFYERSFAVVEEMRHVISFAGEEEKSKLASSLPEEFKTNLFRFKYCEDFVRLDSDGKLIIDSN